MNRSALAAVAGAVTLAFTASGATAAITARKPSLTCPSGYRPTKTTLNGLQVIVCAKPRPKVIPPRAPATTAKTVTPTTTSGGATVHNGQ